MSLLTVCNALALNVGLAQPSVIATAPDREWAEALQFANEAGLELARRVDWGVLTKSTTITGDGVTQTFTLPADFDRLTIGIAVRQGTNVLRSLSQAEWAGLPSATGTPRYFKLDGNQIRFWPIPLDATTVSVSYVSTQWLTGATGYASDADEALIPEDVLEKALIVRWRRQKGMPYQDEEAEYEAALADQARFDDRARF